MVTAQNLIDLVESIPLDQAPQLALLSNTVATLCDDDASIMATLLRRCSDVITRQHLMLQQAKLLPRVEFQQSGSTH